MLCRLECAKIGRSKNNDFVIEGKQRSGARKKFEDEEIFGGITS